MSDLERALRKMMKDARQGLKAKRYETKLRNQGRLSALENAIVAVRMEEAKRK